MIVALKTDFQSLLSLSCFVETDLGDSPSGDLHASKCLSQAFEKGSLGVCCVIQINQKNDGVVQIFTWKITQLEKNPSIT